MNQRKIGTLPLCCMMIGSVLGSGIIILPPLALEAAGPWAIVGWILTTLFGVAFAYLFAKVGSMFPGEGGAASAVERAFGSSAKRLAAYTLSGAVLFGPVAVILTIVEYLPPAIKPATAMGQAGLGAVIQMVCALLVISGLRNMSRFTLVLATTATALLLAGSGMVFFNYMGTPAPLPSFDGPAFGYTMLLLFWAVVGWEVVGNYGGEVIDPKRTIPRAAIMAAVVIGVVSLAVAGALQYGQLPPEAGHGVSALLYPLFGSLAPWIMGALTVALCTTTYLVIIGAVTRLLAHLSRETGLPDALDRRNRHNAPWVGMLFYTAVHLIQFVLVGFGVLDLAGLVAIADGFFLANALLGTLAGIKLFTSPLPRFVATLLSIGVFMVLLQSHWPVQLTLIVLAAFVLLRARRRALSAI
ncbi:amino acid permease [Pseudodesulfovibrio sp. zrk46]|uniref:APC family permease n=1 Tax=Pseudodesulfovibrio sp. zrk46 TaxID=2725288 RepID=UPI0014499599|nr:amino acid permease [Pseudodesulfovibrio sp. zrk46]QJB55657.1 amino acid permease [Pseudodesulfovibrio sp. zrk46]